MKISFCLPTYNEAADIRDVIERILSLSHQTWELNIVDASSDSTPDIINEYVKADVRINLRRQDGDIGRCGARNQALSMSTGSVICILNADVFVSDLMIERAIEAIEIRGLGCCSFQSMPLVDSPYAEYLEAKVFNRCKTNWHAETAIRYFGAFSSEGCFVSTNFISAAIHEFGQIYPSWADKQIRSGDDFIAFERLRAVGLIGECASSVCCYHAVSSKLDAFFSNRLSRGLGNIEYQRFALGISRARLWSRAIAKIVIGLASEIFALNFVADMVRYYQGRDRKTYGVTKFLFSGFIDRLGHFCGEILGLWQSFR